MWTPVDKKRKKAKFECSRNVRCFRGIKMVMMMTIGRIKLLTNREEIAIIKNSKNEFI